MQSSGRRWEQALASLSRTSERGVRVAMREQQAAAGAGASGAGAGGTREAEGGRNRFGGRSPGAGAQEQERRSPAPYAVLPSSECSSRETENEGTGRDDDCAASSERPEMTVCEHHSLSSFSPQTYTRHPRSCGCCSCCSCRCCDRLAIPSSLLHSIVS